MRNLVLAVVGALAIFTFSAECFADSYVRGYYRKDGTYVRPHYRSSPDNSYNNNWSVSPNVNPYTGERGTRRPTWNDQPPSSNYGISPYGNSNRSNSRGLFGN